MLINRPYVRWLFVQQYTDEIPLVYHNSLGWTRYQYVQAAVSSNNPERIRVFDAEGNAVPFQSSGNPRAGG